MKAKWKIVLRVPCCMLLMTVMYVLQTAFGAHMRVFGGGLDFLPILTAAVGMCMGSSAGLVCGLYAGILYDLGAGIEGLFPMYYMFWGILCGYIGEHTRHLRALWTAGCAFGMGIVLFPLRYLFFYQFEGAGLEVFYGYILLRAVLTLVFAPIVYQLLTWLFGKKPTAAQQEV